MFKTGAFALALFAAAAHGEAEGFIGNWDNPKPGMGGLSHVAISPNGGDRVDVRAYGNCHPNLCNWGFVQGKLYTADPKSGRVEAIVAVIHFGFAHRQIIFRQGPGGSLRYEMLTDFADGSDKRDFLDTGTLRPSAWAGPVSQTWSSPAGLRTGWGGGPRAGDSPPAQESCIRFDTKRTRAREKNGAWALVSGDQVLVEAGGDEKHAKLAEAAVHFYRFDRHCTVGGPFKSYWKRGDGFPDQQMGSAQCISFNPLTAHLVRIGRDWKIVDGRTWIVELGRNKDKAEAMLALIRRHRLTDECFVRRPDPLLVYWLAR